MKTRETAVPQEAEQEEEGRRPAMATGVKHGSSQKPRGDEKAPGSRGDDKFAIGPGEDVCDATCINPDAVTAVRQQMIDGGTASDLADLFRVMGDPTRLRMISLLAASELCVCDIAAALKLTQSAVSHQLRVLRMMKLVKFRKEGRAAYYSLDDDHVQKLYAQGLDHLGHTVKVSTDTDGD
jgi:DNA-binding transcriptional ArsR family regulator